MMTNELEDLFGRLSDHERRLAETIGEVSELANDAALEMSLGAAEPAMRERPASGAPSEGASASLRLEQALSRLAEAGELEAAEKRAGGVSKFFSPEELAKAIQRGANLDAQKNERDRLLRESNEHLKSIDEKIGRLAEAGKELYF